jgi:two-component system nitrate/nitrite response regulator NarP
MRVRVVFADDHPFIRSGVETALSGSGFDIVASVGTGAEALSAIAQHDPEIAILDVSMPEGNGIEVLRALRARGDARAVIVLTANLEDGDLLAVLEDRVDGIVMKHDGVEELIACLETVRAGRRHISSDLLARAGRIRATIAASPFKRLTAREAELAWMVGQGLRNREIGERLKMREGAVKFALHAIFRKLHVTSRTELALLLQRHELD